MEPSAFVGLLAGQVRVAAEEEVRVVAELRQRARQTFHAHSEAAGLAVLIRTFEAEDHEDRRLRA